MHIYWLIFIAYEQLRRACHTRGFCLHVSESLRQSRVGLTGEVAGQLVRSVTMTLRATHEGDLLEDVLLEEGDGAHEERNGNTGGDTPADERTAEGAEEPEACVSLLRASLSCRNILGGETGEVLWGQRLSQDTNQMQETGRTSEHGRRRHRAESRATFERGETCGVKCDPTLCWRSFAAICTRCVALVLRSPSVCSTHGLGLVLDLEGSHFDR